MAGKFVDDLPEKELVENSNLLLISDGTNLYSVTWEQIKSQFVHIVETWHSGTEWCRVWSDGWCEQGGISDTIPGDGGVTVNLHKTMADTNYWIGGGVASGNINHNGIFAPPTQKTVSSFQLDFCSPDAVGPAYWEVKGYIASN